MLAEIITIGDEILIGQIVDTNSVYISKKLNSIGVEVYQITSVKDDRAHILQTLKEAQNRVDLVLVTGGLGPTKDDITKQVFCDFFEDTLTENVAVLNNIKTIFKDYIKQESLTSNLMQAMVPTKATILQNLQGTAPGMWFEKNNTVFVAMPGVPNEMKYLVDNEMIPRIVKKFNRPFIYHKTLLTYGVGESTIAERISYWEEDLPTEIKLAYLPSFGKVRLRLSSKGIDENLIKNAVDAQMEMLRNMLKDIAIGYENETSIEQNIAKLLIKNGHTLSLAESCTGGAIAQHITARAGASAYFRGSIIPYATEIKSTVLGVDENLIKKHTVVSGVVAEAMAVQSQKCFNTDYAIATTGIAGPSKGDAMGEVGTVFIAIGTPAGVVSEKFNFGNARERVIAKATNKALEMLLKEISKN